MQWKKRQANSQQRSLPSFYPRTSIHPQEERNKQQPFSRRVSDVLMRVLSQAQAGQTLEEFDNMLLSPNLLESIWAINCYIDRCSNPEPIVGSLHHMLDACISEYETCAELKPTKLKSAHHSVIETIKIQLRLKSVILEKEEPFHKFQHAQASVFQRSRELCGNTAAFRQNCVGHLRERRRWTV